MLGVYLFAAIVGAGLLALSLLAGHDAHHDVGAGGGDDHPVLADADHPGLGELVLVFLRPRNLIFGLAGFGLTGTLLTLLHAGPLLTPVASATMGTGFLFLSHAVFTALKRTESGGAALSDADIMGERARVTLALEPGRPGRVACVMAGREVYLTARLDPAAAEGIPAGREVVVIRVTNGVAEVATPEQYERLPSA
jgi:hypothetical protein